MLMASLIWSLCWVFVISLNKYLVPQIKRTLRYLFISIINEVSFVGFSVGLWDIRMRGYWFSVCGFYLVYKWDALGLLAFCPLNWSEHPVSPSWCYLLHSWGFLWTDVWGASTVGQALGWALWPWLPSSLVRAQWWQERLFSCCTKGKGPKWGVPRAT